MSHYQLLREHVLSPPILGYDPARTARKQVPAILRDLARSGAMRDFNLDLGGGPWDLGSEFLLGLGCFNLILDPYARTSNHNRTGLDVLDLACPDGVPTVTVGNVLNVLAEPDARRLVVRQAFEALKPGGVAFFLIHEGDRSGRGGPTRDGWQANLPTAHYLTLITPVFGSVGGRRGRRSLHARKPTR